MAQTEHANEAKVKNGSIYCIVDPGSPETTADDMLNYPGMQEALSECISNEYEEHEDMTDEEMSNMIIGVGKLIFRS